MIRGWFAFLMFALFATVILIPHGLASTAAEEAVGVRTAWSANRARPGDSILLAIVADIKKGFHINADERQIKAFEDFKPIPTKVSVIAAPDAITIEAPRYPQAVPFKAQYATGDLMSYAGQIIIYLPIKLEETAEPGGLNLKLRFQYQACTDNYCLLPKRIMLKETLVVVKSVTQVAEINQE
jgi:hypothetical protein